MSSCRTIKKEAWQKNHAQLLFPVPFLNFIMTCRVSNWSRIQMVNNTCRKIIGKIAHQEKVVQHITKDKINDVYILGQKSSFTKLIKTSLSSRHVAKSKFSSLNRVACLVFWVPHTQQSSPTTEKVNKHHFYTLFVETTR